MDEDEMEALVIILVRHWGLVQKNSVSIELDVFKTSILFVWLG
jgi:hypothetical protein